MKIRLNIADAGTNDWQEDVFFELEEYASVFKQEYPGIPCPERFEHMLILKKCLLDIDDANIYIDVLYDKPTHLMTLNIWDDDANVLKVMAPAFGNSNESSSIVYVVPSAKKSINIVTFE
jgi:hypothetical protein